MSNSVAGRAGDESVLPCIEVDHPAVPSGAATAVTGRWPQASVIWLHGLGADGHDFVPIVPELKLPADLPVRFVFPHAPVRPVTINGGAPMRAWFDIRKLNFRRAVDEQAMDLAASQLAALVARERQRGVAAERIVVAGFSQGGAVALWYALHQPEPPPGVLALSTFLPGGEQALATAGNCRGLPVFYGHGENDEVIPVANAIIARDLLIGAGCRVEWHEYEMGHQVCYQEIADISAWLQRLLT